MEMLAGDSLRQELQWQAQILKRSSNT
jgi:hypothetical protein